MPLLGQFVPEDEIKTYSYEEHLKPFHHANNGRILAQALLYESPSNDKSTAIFTLKDRDYVNQDGNYLFSIARLYRDIGDLTEYEFAEHVFGSWKAWKVFCQMPVFQETLSELREELEIKERSRAIREIQQIAQTSKPQTAMTAAKYIAEKGWEQKGAGRPTKKEIERQQRIAAGIDKEFEEDFNRIQTKTY